VPSSWRRHQESIALPEAFTPEACHRKLNKNKNKITFTQKLVPEHRASYETSLNMLHRQGDVSSVILKGRFGVPCE
jgi:hypothetical protein